MKTIIITQLLIIALVTPMWCINLVKLINCDFKAPYKGEVIHAIGLVPPAFLITVWFNETDKP
jgi:hypothetical protein